MNIERCEYCGVYFSKDMTQYSHECNPSAVEAFLCPRFQTEWTTWLKTPRGRFEVFYAERCRTQEGAPLATVATETAF